MKKVLYCLVFFIFSNICIYAASSKKVAVFNVGITSGIPFYGDDSLLASNNLVNGGEINRVLVGLSADVAFNLATPIKLIAGSDLLADFIWGGSSYSNHLDYSFFCGIKVYPNLFGFNTSIAYLLGSRTDFIDNDFIIKQIDLARKYWTIETKQLFDFCFDMTQRTFMERQKVGYKNGLDAVDAGFIQISETFSDDILYKNNFIRLLTVYKEKLYKDISKFGFLREF